MSFEERYTHEQEEQMFEPNTGAKHEIICKQKKKKKILYEEPIEYFVCTQCNKNNTKDQIRFINCKLKGIKKEKIGYYKAEDKAICLCCIKKCKVAKLGDKVQVKYIKLKRGIWRNIPHDVFTTGKLIVIKNPTNNNSDIVIKTKNKELS